MLVYREHYTGQTQPVFIYPAQDGGDDFRDLWAPPVALSAMAVYTGALNDPPPKRKALVIEVKFVDGRAEVEDRIGKYLVQRGHAFKTPQKCLGQW